MAQALPAPFFGAGVAAPLIGGGVQVLGAGVGPVAPLPRFGARLMPTGGGFVLDEPSVELKVGTPIAWPAGTVVQKGVALVEVEGDMVKVRFLAAGTDVDDYAHSRQQFLVRDPRVLPRPLDRSDGEFRTIARDMEEDALLSLPFGGPKTAGFMVEHAAPSSVGGFVARHDRWRAASGVGARTPILYEHEVLSRALQYAVVHDFLNLKALACVEFLMRRMQLLEDVVAENPSAPSFEAASHYMGSAERAGGAVMAPSLRAHVSGELGREAAILKEKMKAREARGGGGGGRGGGRGGGKPAAKDE